MKWLILFLFSFPAFSSELWLKVGEVRHLNAPRTSAVKVGGRGVIRIIDAENGIRIVGLKPGSVSLIVGESSYNVRVSHSAQKNFVQELRAVVGKMMGLKLAFNGDSPEVRGTLLRFSDWLTLARLARQYEGEYVFRARPLPDVAEEALTHLRDLARQQGYPIVRFSHDPEFTAELPQTSPALKAAAAASLRPYGIQVDMSKAELSLQPLVKTRVIVAEVSRQFSREFGVQWPSEYLGQILPRIAPGQTDLMATLKALESRGEAQILASPNLLCRSGGEARFHAGGEFPIRMTSRSYQNVEWKSHGVLLRVKPRADFQGAMSLEVETEVSLLDAANSVDGIPALKKNSVKSHFDLAGKRTIALSGLLRQELGQAREGLPLLSSLPVLGPLFSSRRFQSRQSELVIFVTPEVTGPESDEKIEMPKGWVVQDAFGN
ncbi:MAG: hypothetical protein KF799_12935 [Bdellovibrionales bacterium]|nr:hypothetical protein [Bdellovibrionales bacterium]